MAESISSLIADTESPLVGTGHVVIYAPNGRIRKRYPEGCVRLCASEAEARATARPHEGYYAAVASGPSRSSEGFRLYYLVRWLD
ncbi:MAG: hypothetical protein FJ209_04570 [Betaproteobacteria bacterium]|nr:hypothetical protein [Betaproteobacteria bacterium]